MNDFKRQQLTLMNRSGLGPLAGIGLAFVLCVLVMAGLLLETWWAMFVVLGVLFVIALIVTAVILMIAGEQEEDEDGTPRLGPVAH